MTRKDKLRIILWYAIVGAGSGPKPARGPHRTLEDAREAVERFRERHGAVAGTHLAAGSDQRARVPYSRPGPGR